MFAPQDSWPWPSNMVSHRQLPAHTALIPSTERLRTICSCTLLRALIKVGAELPRHVIDNAAHQLATRLGDFDANDACIHEASLTPLRASLRGLVIEEFQKSRHTMVAECPARVWKICRGLFGANGNDHHFLPCPSFTQEQVLYMSSNIPHLPTHLQPHKLSRPGSWEVAIASAPNKKRSKPNSRRPIIDRSRWPTTPLDCAAARCLDYVSLELIPQHLHLDLHRTDQLVKLLEQFNKQVAVGRAHGIGGDLVSCFTNIPHTLVLQAWCYYNAILIKMLIGFSAPRRRGHGKVRPFMSSDSSRQLINLTPDNIDKLLRHHLLTAWFKCGSLMIKQIEGLPMGSGLASALTRMVLVYLDVIFMMSPGYMPIPGYAYHCRCRHVYLSGYALVLLEVRYMDDYLALFKFIDEVENTASAVATITTTLQSNLRRRYPLPLEADDIKNFLGLELACTPEGTITLRPQCSSPPLYDIDHGFPSTMIFNSFLPLTIKRSLVIGLLACINRYTIPCEHKPAVLGGFLRVLMQHGFPIKYLRKWATARRFDIEWASQCFQ